MKKTHFVAWWQKNKNWIQNCVRVRERAYKEPKYEWKSRIQGTHMNAGSGDSGRHSIKEFTKIPSIFHKYFGIMINIHTSCSERFSFMSCGKTLPISQRNSFSDIARLYLNKKISCNYYTEFYVMDNLTRLPIFHRTTSWSLSNRSVFSVKSTWTSVWGLRRKSHTQKNSSFKAYSLINKYLNLS